MPKCAGKSVGLIQRLVRHLGLAGVASALLVAGNAQQ